MRKLLTRVSCAAVTFSLGVGAYLISPLGKPAVPIPQITQTPRVEPASPPAIAQTESVEDYTVLTDLFTSEETLHYNGYMIEKRYKTVKVDDSSGGHPQGYVLISRNGKAIKSFDATYYYPLGNAIEFGLFPFLGAKTKQLAISQDVPRGGAQWIVDMTSAPRIVFDGPAWGAGREAGDCVVEDLDKDGVFEISVPLADFYELMDKMSMSEIPLPWITFKFDPKKQKYFPANQALNHSDSSTEADVTEQRNERSLRSSVLRYALELIYESKRDQAWQYFNSKYNLDDKNEIERRVKAILRNQPVYKYIYKNR